MNIFHKLRNKVSSRSSRASDSEPAVSSSSSASASAPAREAADNDASDTMNAALSSSVPPRAMHISEVKRSPHLVSSIRMANTKTQSITVMVAHAKGAADYLGLYTLLQRETKYGSEFDPTGDSETDYVCNGHMYNVRFTPMPGATGQWATNLAMLTMMQHVCLVLTYDGSSSSGARESWEELVAVYERLRGRSEDAVVTPRPFGAVMIVAMGEESEAPAGSAAEAEAFATQRGCHFVQVSPRTGRGVCDAIGSLVERTHGARGEYHMDKDGEPKRYKRAQMLKAMFSPS
ncbi:hypothetical protein FE257_012787 [Aspergillus nanangensis]|uniref:Uncharacterized protein n=1 Tax=Aspergillus nanangensis TaxID=2582783 RepID=A0AAD4GQJ7_ASPNN|nr:hypothetical protein FE257_012787 [Aspergillus nanangensis]